MKDLVERARVESVSFSTTDEGRTLFFELAEELAAARAVVEAARRMSSLFRAEDPAIGAVMAAQLTMDNTLFDYDKVRGK